MKQASIIIVALLFLLASAQQQLKKAPTTVKANLQAEVVISATNNEPQKIQENQPTKIQQSSPPKSEKKPITLINQNVKTVEQEIKQHKETETPKSSYTFSYDKDAYNKMMSLCSFQTIMDKFPFLERNMKPSVLAELHTNGECHNTQYQQFNSTGFAILDNQAYIVEKYKPDQFYNKILNIPLLAYFNEVLKNTTIPDTYFLFNVMDGIKPIQVPAKDKEACRSIPLFLFNKNATNPMDMNKFLMPDMYMINSLWAQEKKRVEQVSAKIPWKDKKSMMFFRGISTTPNIYEVWLDEKTPREAILKYHHRGGFVILSAEHPDKIDAKFNNDVTKLTGVVQRMVGNKTIMGKFSSIQQQLQYKFLLTADGFGSSWKRPQYYLSSNSLLVKPYSGVVQWFYDKLIPDVNYIMLKEDLSDIFDRLDELSNNDQKCIQISKNANEIANKYLTPSAISQYTSETLRKFANIQKLNLTKQQKEKIKAGGDFYALMAQKRKEQLAQIDRNFIKEWLQISALASFEIILSRFNFLKENIKVNKMTELLKKGKCNKNMLSFAIIGNTVYTTGTDNQKENSKWLYNFLTARLKKQALPDMYFLYSGTQDIQDKDADKLCRELPVFSTSKRIYSSLEQTRFLIPEITNNANNQNTLGQWEKKTKKAYFLANAEVVAQQLKTTTKVDISTYGRSLGAALALLYEERPDLLETRFSSPKDISTLDGLQKLLGSKAVINQDSTEPKFRYRIVVDQHNDGKVQELISSSNSVIMMPLPKRVHWIHSKISPTVHFVPLSTDFSDCFSKIIDMNKGDTIAKQIFEKANSLAQQQLSQNALEEQILEILRKYAILQQWWPSEKTKQQIQNGTSIEQALTANQ